MLVLNEEWKATQIKLRNVQQQRQPANEHGNDTYGTARHTFCSSL